ncbi:MAG: hypothetical protein QM662_04310 [Gordonia sp. (in: high G+C Gram-positive bacteria)]
MIDIKRCLVGIVFAASATIGGTGVAQAVSPVETNGSITDASSDIEVAEYGYQDLTMNRFAHQEAASYAGGVKSATEATYSLNSHIAGGRYCAAARMIGRALADQGYNSATNQTFYSQSGCLGAPSVTHAGPNS